MSDHDDGERTGSDGLSGPSGDGRDGRGRGGSEAHGDAPEGEKVAAAMEAVPRDAFLPAGLQHLAGVDTALPLREGSTCSQPSTVRDMLTLLDVRTGQQVLDVGSGSGWTTALLTHLASPGGSVTGVELDPALVASSRTALDHVVTTDGTAAATASWWVEQAVPGTLGWPRGAPTTASWSRRTPGVPYPRPSWTSSHPTASWCSRCGAG